MLRISMCRTVLIVRPFDASGVIPGVTSICVLFFLYTAYAKKERKIEKSNKDAKHISFIAECCATLAVSKSDDEFPDLTFNRM